MTTVQNHTAVTPGGHASATVALVQGGGTDRLGAEPAQGVPSLHAFTTRTEQIQPSDHLLRYPTAVR